MSSPEQSPFCPWMDAIGQASGDNTIAIAFRKTGSSRLVFEEDANESNPNRPVAAGLTEQRPGAAV